MKNCCLVSVIILLSCLNSCQREEPGPDKPKGFLRVNIGLFIHVSEVSSQLKSTPGAEDFKVIIFNSRDEEVLVFERASEMPPDIELEIGDYYVAASSDNNLPAAFENPYYYGASGRFTIVPGASQTVTVNCELANTMVSVVYSENVRNNFTNYSTTVSSSAGSLTFTPEEIRAGYFQPLPLNITATLTWQKSDGSPETRTLTGTIASPQPKKHYEIHVDANGTTGNALFNITLDENPVAAEIVEITGNSDSPSAGQIQQGDILFSEIMYDPTLLSDTEGEWIEIYNNSNNTIDLQNLVIRKNDTESHVIGNKVTVPSHAYYVLARTSSSFSGEKYVYGTDITLNNTGATLSISNYGTDGTDGSVICSLNYGSEGFPHASGASVCLDPAKLNITEATLGSSWCISSSAYGPGDLGTPGSANDSCN